MHDAYSLHNKANMPTSYSVKWQGQLQSCHHLKTWLDLRVGKVARGHEGDRLLGIHGACQGRSSMEPPVSPDPMKFAKINGKTLLSTVPL